MEETKKLIAQLTGAVAYAHSKNCAHRDLKLENILLDRHFDVKLADFGFTREYPANTLLETVCGTTCYMAPEMLMRKKYSGEAVDVWSLGVILYTLLFGEMPFEEDTDLDTKKKILNEEPRYPDPDIIGPPLSLVQSMLSKDPRTRPSLATVLNNTWLDKYGTQQKEILAEKEPKPFSTRPEKRLLRAFRAAHFDIDRLRESVLLAKCDQTAGIWELSLRRELKRESKQSHRNSIGLPKYSLSRKNSSASNKDKTPLIIKSLGRRSVSASRTASVQLVSSPSQPISPKQHSSNWGDVTDSPSTNNAVPVVEVSPAPEPPQLEQQQQQQPRNPQVRTVSKYKSEGVLASRPTQESSKVAPAKSLSTITTNEKKKNFSSSFKNAFLKFVSPSQHKRKVRAKKSGASSLFSGIMDNLSKHSSSDKEKDRNNTSSPRANTSTASAASSANDSKNARVIVQETNGTAPDANATLPHHTPNGNENVNYKYTPSPRQSDDLGQRSSMDHNELLNTPTFKTRTRPVSQISQFSLMSGVSQFSAYSQLSSAASQLSQDLSASEISVNGSRTSTLRRPHLSRRSTSSSFSSLQSSRRNRHQKRHSKASSTSSASATSRSPSRRRRSGDSERSRSESTSSRAKAKRSSDIITGGSSSMANRYKFGTQFPHMSSSTSATRTETKWSSSSSRLFSTPEFGGSSGGRFNETAIFGSKMKSHRRRLGSNVRSFSPRSSISSGTHKGLHGTSLSRSHKENPIAEADEIEDDMAELDGKLASVKLSQQQEQQHEEEEHQHQPSTTNGFLHTDISDMSNGHIHAGQEEEDDDEEDEEDEEEEDVTAKVEAYRQSMTYEEDEDDGEPTETVHPVELHYQ